VGGHTKLYTLAKQEGAMDVGLATLLALLSYTQKGILHSFEMDYQTAK
jgi:hypothetical protein